MRSRRCTHARPGLSAIDARLPASWRRSAPGSKDLPQASRAGSSRHSDSRRVSPGETSVGMSVRPAHAVCGPGPLRDGIAQPGHAEENDARHACRSRAAHGGGTLRADGVAARHVSQLDASTDAAADLGVHAGRALRQAARRLRLTG